MHDFQQSIILDFNVAMSALVQVDVERAEAFSKGDRDRILSSVLALDNGAGYHYVNKLVSGKMRDWLIASAESLLEKQLRGMQGGTGDDNDVKPFMTANVVASILGDQGDLHRSIALYNLALNGLERIVGPESEAAIRVGQNLASSLTKTNDPTDLQEAGRLFMRGLKIRERCLGKLHRDTLHSRYLLGTWLFEVGDLGGAREALQVTHDGWEVRRKREETKQLHFSRIYLLADTHFLALTHLFVSFVRASSPVSCVASHPIRSWAQDQWGTWTR